MAKASQKVIVKIGHIDVLLPDDTGVTQIMKTLSRAIVVWDLSSTVQIRDEELQLSMRYVPDKTKFETQDKQPVPDPRPKKKGRVLELKPPSFLALMGGNE